MPKKNDMRTQIDKLTKKLNDKIINKILNDKLLRFLAIEMVTMMKLRVRRGKGVKQELGSEHKFPPLKPSTIRARKYLKKQGKLMSGVGPSRNGLIASGQLTNAIYYILKKSGIRLKVIKNRVGENINNHELMDWQKKNNREFFHVSKKEFDKIKKILRAKLKELIKAF